ncbi:MAG: poly(3-hydroxyalkanoate) depolymerase [Rudaea sp.]|uniref:poly(3-hydroxyalkanoate) depolymerase n=1 Tax=unclassified Rudaea TaxID=2627037 RepID=UPI0010F90B9F|nr:MULTISPECIES: poly(3-hydroxyalkanoate) depolymerase [unclassified Rudaea]MBN8887112.1 poly(3-hydroxyalkanoate) depolymerase [Rudaea sp.]MBR0347506.1 poly(3-hydroxyalkanoate) depolymerase [Rudaea sp.]
MTVAVATPLKPGSKRRIELRQIDVLGTSLRVAVWPGDKKKTPLLLFNGIGASLELLAPFVDALGDIETIVFDAPGVGESSLPPIPYRLWMLSLLSSRVLDAFGYARVDALGVSWGGAMAQQFALQNPRRCQRLILAATSQGVLMVPPKPSVLAKFLTPRRFNDPVFRRAIAGDIYGGKARTQPGLLREFHKTGRVGYLLQQLAIAGWTSLPWLPLLRQPTLILAGDDDPVIPLVNARLMARLIRNARLHVFHDGHLFLISDAAEAGRVVRTFLGEREKARPKPDPSRARAREGYASI